MPVDAAYVDTSVLGAYYCPEPLSEAAESALLAVREPCISTLTEVEFASLVARKRRLRELSERQATEVLRLFDEHVTDGHYRRLALGTEHFLRAREMITARQSSLHTLDALHLAAALLIDAPLLTADQLLARAARRHDAATILVK
jgi:predicted nucleic acid-binding protein